MNKQLIIIISIIIVAGAGIFIALFYTPSDVPNDIDSTPAITTIPTEDTKSPEENKENVVVPKPTPTPEPNIIIPQQPKEYIVEIHSFTDWRPASLMIFVGDTITFVNLDDDLHWPGSDPHPTHSSLLLFDALGGISKGQSYSHTFTEAGSYGHHDHLAEEPPPQLGIITVLPRE